MDGLAKLYEAIKIEVVITKSNETRLQIVKIQNDFLSKYCKTCKLQVHEEKKCRTLHSELKRVIYEHDEEDTTDQYAKNESNSNVVRGRICVILMWYDAEDAK